MTDKLETLRSQLDARDDLLSPLAAQVYLAIAQVLEAEAILLRADEKTLGAALARSLSTSNDAERALSALSGDEILRGLRELIQIYRRVAETAAK